VDKGDLGILVVHKKGSANARQRNRALKRKRQRVGSLGLAHAN